MSEAIDIHRQWIEQLKNGDETAAENIYDNYSKAMYNTLIRITGNTEEAQDLLQDAFVKAFKQINSYRAEATFGAWLKRIVVNTGLEHLRKRKVEFDELNEGYDYWESDVPVSPGLDPTTVHEAIKKLPPGCRTVLSMYLLEGFTHPEIAGYLKISTSTSKTQYMRGKQILKELLKTKLYG